MARKPRPKIGSRVRIIAHRHDPDLRDLVFTVAKNRQSAPYPYHLEEDGSKKGDPLWGPYSAGELELVDA